MLCCITKSGIVSECTHWKCTQKCTCTLKVYAVLEVYACTWSVRVHHKCTQSGNITVRTHCVHAEVYARVYACTRSVRRVPEVYTGILEVYAQVYACTRCVRKVPGVHLCGHMKCTRHQQLTTKVQCTQCVHSTVLLKKFPKSFWVSAFCWSTSKVFFPTLVTGFWYLAYTSCDRRSVRLVPCVHFSYLAYTFSVHVVFVYTSAYTFAYTSVVHNVCTPLWCWKNFRSLFGYQHFAGQHKFFFFPTLVTGFWYLAYTSCDRRSVRLVPCVHFWCMRTLQVPCVHF